MQKKMGKTLAGEKIDIILHPILTNEINCFII